PGQDGQPAWQSPGRLMGLATAYAVFLLVALFIGFSGADGGFVGMLQGEVAASLSPMITEGPEADRLVTDLSAQVAKAVPGSDPAEEMEAKHSAQPDYAGRRHTEVADGRRGCGFADWIVGGWHGWSGGLEHSDRSRDAVFFRWLNGHPRDVSQLGTGAN
ncbi:MAG: hypothetical protein ACKVG0_10965, partial [Alphaproteobacteria bacterium]